MDNFTPTQHSLWNGMITDSPAAPIGIMDTFAQKVVEQLQDVDAVYVILDIDCLDPAFAPGTGTPEAGGFSTRELLEFLRVMLERLPVSAMDIVEVAPPLDYAGITAMAAVKIIYEVFGWLQNRGDLS